jgi:hypothetical protein
MGVQLPSSGIVPLALASQNPSELTVGAGIKIADAFHALTDMVSDIMTLATVSFALKAPTDRFPNGYGKIESLGSLGVSSLLFLGGMAMGLFPLLPSRTNVMLKRSQATALYSTSSATSRPRSHTISLTYTRTNIHTKSRRSTRHGWHWLRSVRRNGSIARR